jgi:hypothetical protein
MINHWFFALHFYIRDAVIRKHENCAMKMQIEKTILLIERIESNFDMSNWYRREIFQNLNRSRSQIMMNKFFAHATFRRFNSVYWKRRYSFVLNKTHWKFQTSIRFTRVDQVTQKWRNFVARFFNAFYQRIFLLSKRKDEMIFITVTSKIMYDWNVWFHLTKRNSNMRKKIKICKHCLRLANLNRKKRC